MDRLMQSKMNGSGKDYQHSALQGSFAEISASPG